MLSKLGETLIQAGRIDSRQLQEALRTQRIFGGALGTHLLQLGFIEEQVLAEALAKMHQVPVASRREVCQAAPEIVALLSAEFSKRHRALPFRVEGESLLLALQNPADTLAIHEAAFLTGFNILAHVAPETVLREALEIHHPSMTSPAGASSPTPPTAPPAAVTQPAATAPPRPPRVPASLQEAGQRLIQADSRDGVLEIALDALDQWCQRSALFTIRGDESSLLLARRLSIEPGRDLGLGLSNSQIFSTLGGEESQPYCGSITPTPADQRFYSLVGGGVPQRIVVVPIDLRGRPVAALYGDSARDDGQGPDQGQLLRLASITAMALESQILRLKILKTSGNQP